MFILALLPHDAPQVGSCFGGPASIRASRLFPQLLEVLPLLAVQHSWTKLAQPSENKLDGHKLPSKEFTGSSTNNLKAILGSAAEFTALAWVGAQSNL